MYESQFSLIQNLRYEDEMIIMASFVIFRDYPNTCEDVFNLFEIVCWVFCTFDWFVYLIFNPRVVVFWLSEFHKKKEQPPLWRPVFVDRRLSDYHSLSMLLFNSWCVLYLLLLERKCLFLFLCSRIYQNAFKIYKAARLISILKL